MKFVIKQERLERMLEKLNVGNMFPSCIFSTRDGKAFSIQREDSARALRMSRFDKEYFESIDEGPIESIDIDMKKYLTMVKKLPPGMILTWELIGNKISITGKKKNGDSYNKLLTYRTPEVEVMTKLPFEIKEGIPLVGNEDIPLDVQLTLDVDKFKEIAEDASTIKSEFYRFTIDDDMLYVRVGDLHNLKDASEFGFSDAIKKGKDLESIFTYGVAQIASAFSKNIHINTRSNSPAWIFESSNNYLVGVFIPPYSGTEE